jgi:hypothetical protein
MRGYAIRVNDVNQANAAIEDFKSVGYRSSEWLNKIPFTTNFYKYVIIGYKNTIEFSAGQYAEDTTVCTIINSVDEIENPPIPHKVKDKTMLKVGDIIKISDGSWNIAIHNGQLITGCGNDMTRHDWKIISLREYKFPISGVVHNRLNDEYKKFLTNDMVVVAVDDPTFVVITNSNLLCFGKYKKPVIKIGENEVKINPGKDIKVGYTTIPAETVKAIIKEWQDE